MKWDWVRPFRPFRCFLTWSNSRKITAHSWSWSLCQQCLTGSTSLKNGPHQFVKLFTEAIPPPEAKFCALWKRPNGMFVWQRTTSSSRTDSGSTSTTGNTSSSMKGTKWKMPKVNLQASWVNSIKVITEFCLQVLHFKTIWVNFGPCSISCCPKFSTAVMILKNGFQWPFQKAPVVNLFN